MILLVVLSIINGFSLGSLYHLRKRRKALKALHDKLDELDENEKITDKLEGFFDGAFFILEEIK